MQSALILCVLILSILLAGAASRGTVRLYFAAQFVATVAEFAFRHSHHYAQIYICSTLLAVEMTVLMLWDAGVSRLTWKDSFMAACWMTVAGGLGLELLSLTDWYLVGEGLLFATLGMAMLLLARRSIALWVIGSLTWLMAVYDFLYLLQPRVRATNWLAEPVMCITAFLILWRLERNRQREEIRAEAEAFKWHLLRTYGSGPSGTH